MYNGIGVAKLQWVIAKLQLGLQSTQLQFCKWVKDTL
jgi:hypothetical protein